MNKTVKIILSIICVIILFVGVVFATFKLTSKDTKVENEPQENKVENETVIDEENIVDENITNEPENVVDENNTTENTAVVPENKVSSKPADVVPSSAVYENSDVGTTDKKEQAINLVKAQWGEDNTVTFRCDSVTSSGEYIIAVVSSETASVKNYFIVNLEKKTVTVDY